MEDCFAPEEFVNYANWRLASVSSFVLENGTKEVSHCVGQPLYGLYLKDLSIE